MTYQLAIYKEEAAPQAQISLGGGNAVRAIYIIHGGLRVRTGQKTSTNPRIKSIRC